MPWAAWRAKGAAGQAASYLDLTGQGRNLGVGVAPTWTAAGWTFDGLTQYLTTTFVPANDQTQSAFVQFTGLTNTGRLCGSVAGSNRYFFLQPNDGSSRVAYGNGAVVYQGPNLAAGNLGVAGSQGYRNGVADGGAIGAYGAVPTYAVALGAAMGATPTAFVACAIAALILFDVALTPTQASLIAAAMAAL